MTNNKKWKLNTNIKFIRCYKQHDCLWNYLSPDYKNRDKRNTAYSDIAKEMNIENFGLQEVKNKVKNLRSTYSQEMKKIEDSKKLETRTKKVYVSSIKWLKEMEEVFRYDVQRNLYENIKSEFYHDDQEHETEEDEDPLSTFSNAQENTSQSMANTDTSNNIAGSGNNKLSTQIITAINDLKSLYKINSKGEETTFDIFGKSVAMQLKALSVENALMAQHKIQTILTEIGIADYRVKTENITPMSTYSYHSVST